jgi:hypothetical protein
MLILTIVFDSLGYIPGYIHAFWLIYKKMQAEERYGSGGFICESYLRLNVLKLQWFLFLQM